VKPSEYRIVVTGELGPRFAARFEPMHLTTRDGETEIYGRVEDDAELQGILETIAVLGLSLVSLARCEDRPSGLRPDDAAKADV
jgi:hypothetical protein